MFCDGKIYSHGTIKPLQTSHVNVLQEMPRKKTFTKIILNLYTEINKI